MSTLAPDVPRQTDPDTGATVIRWTDSPAKDQHLYFTSPSVTADDRWLVIMSERTGDPNLFAIDRTSGELRQISQNTAGLRRAYVYPEGGATGLSKASPCLNADTGALIWIEGDHLMAANVTATDASPREVCELPAVPAVADGWLTGFTHIDAPGRRACVPIADGAAFVEKTKGQVDQMKAAVEHFAHEGLTSRILVIDLESGAIEREAAVPFWVTHVQFSPADPMRLIFNQEGSSRHSINQRIWKWDMAADRVLPLHPQLADEWVCHENFSPDGACVISHGGRRGDESEQWFERRDWSGKLLQRIPTGGKSGFHAILGTDGQTVLLDAHDGELWAWDLDTDESTLLCRHDTSFWGQDVHAHPVMTPDERGVVFTSDKDQEKNVGDVYECRLGD